MKATITRAATLIIPLTDGQASYLFNVTTFRNKTITKIEVQDPTGQGLVNAPDGSVLADTALVTQSYINLVSAINTTDNVVQSYPTSRFMPSTGTGTGAGLSNYNEVELSGWMNLDIQNSTLKFPDPAAVTGVTGKSILIMVWYDDRDPQLQLKQYNQWAGQ